MIYLDNAATTCVDKRVLEDMLPFFCQNFGNPESVHAAASLPSKAISEAEQHVARLLNTNGKGKIIFTSGGTESNNMAFRLAGFTDPLCINMITSPTEHKSVLEPAKACMSSRLTMIKPGKKGYVSAEDFNPDQIPAFTLVSIMGINNETGAVNDVYRIGDMLSKANKPEVFFHVDCVQTAGTSPIDVIAMHADLVSVSSHKIHGPKGVGCLWVSERILDRVSGRHTLAMITGGGQQEGFRAGTMNVSGIVGFGSAAKYIMDEFANGSESYIAGLSDLFVNALSSACQNRDIRFTVNFRSSGHHHPKILSVTFPGADAETVVMIASQNGLCVSNGAACNSVLSEPSYVLVASGMSPDMARNTIRVSFSRQNSYDECKQGAEILAEAVRETLSLTGLAD